MFNAEDIFDSYSYMFTDKAVKALNFVKCESTIYQYNKFDGQWQKRVEPSALAAAQLSLIKKQKSIEEKFIETITRLFDIEPTYTRQIAQVRYFGVKIEDQSKRDKSIKRLADKISEFAELGFIMGHMAKLMEIKLGVLPGQTDPNHSVVVSYFIVTDEGIKHLDSNKNNLEIREGELPKSLED